MTYGIDMTQKTQMWELTIAAVPFYWIANKVFARRTSLVGLSLPCRDASLVVAQSPLASTNRYRRCRV
jgi:hypothetical protein